MGQQIVDSERPRVRRVGVEGMDQGWSFQDDPNPGMAMAVDPPFVTLG
jgi:hypothetical protein